MRRLYLQIYVAFLGILGLFALLAAGAWWLSPERRDQTTWDGLGAVAADLLPASAGPAALQGTLDRLSGRLQADLTLWSADGRPLAAVGEHLPFPGRERTRGGWFHLHGRPVGAVQLPDGRWLLARHRTRRLGHEGLVTGLLLLALAVAVGAHPVARRLTRRLERLRAGVEKVGGGDLRARVEVEGRDEVAALAESFNRAASRIEALVGAQRTLLAGASHELRSPLARIRVALELMSADRPELREGVRRDVAELDALIEELLLASRLEAAETPGAMEEVDLLGLLGEEAARGEVEVRGEPLLVRGEPRLLRRLVRNLLENAWRHGAAPFSASVEAAGGKAFLRVCDAGPGVPEAERSRIFEPFHRAGRAGGEGGVGLGLSLVLQIARRHGGGARCLPREEGGICFEVELPLPSPRG